uniref:Mitochondrial fission regulator n=1 Tax=Neogobius melanostomus TaxID=47308 RepID=A0A8C6U4L6_9GOBI
MSLLDDVCMYCLVPVWDCELCGQYRSIVRMIGTNLPLPQTPRIHFQIPLLSHKPRGYGDITVETPSVPSFADVLWVFEDVGDGSTKTRSPGGSPVRRRRSKGASSLHSDPAALIAEALKKKFAQHYHNNSSDKENSRELSPFSSPETPKAPIHIRRSQGRRYM